MFLRFVSTDFDEDSQCRLGVFQTAYELRESGRLSHYEEAGLLEVLRWFDDHLERPTRFSRSVKRWRQPKAVCWFRSSAKEHLQRIWQMVGILEANAAPIQMIKTKTPGYVVYEDDFQVIAESFVELKRSERR